MSLFIIGYSNFKIAHTKFYLFYPYLFRLKHIQTVIGQTKDNFLHPKKKNLQNKYFWYVNLAFISLSVDQCCILINKNSVLGAQITVNDDHRLIGIIRRPLIDRDKRFTDMEKKIGI